MYFKRILLYTTWAITWSIGFGADNTGKVVVFHYNVDGIMKTQDESTKIFINNTQLCGINQDEIMVYTTSANEAVLVGVSYYDAHTSIYAPVMPGATTYVGINIKYKGVLVIGTVGVGLQVLSSITAEEYLRNRGYKSKNYYDRQEQQTGSKKNDATDKYLSGTGFLFTSDGLVATNYHVVKGARKILLYGVAGNMKEPYEAIVLAEDEAHDIALLQLKKPVPMGIIPYVHKTDLAETGEEVFVLGYPWGEEMGLEIKYTNGVINSQSGYRGDVTQYQISAPVQGGNDGSPLFDRNGNLLGIVNSTFDAAQLVNYAIKLKYVEDLMYTIDGLHSVNMNNKLKGLALTEQIKAIKQFVYYIEVE